MTWAIRVRDAGKVFVREDDSTVDVIEQLNLEIAEGSFVTLVGRSGCGKSTLLNMIAQIDVASAGEIIFQGDRIVTADPKAMRPGLDRRVGYVTQDDNLLPWRTTLENVLFPLKVQGRPGV